MSVWYHHSYSSELYFEIFREFLTSGISRILRKFHEWDNHKVIAFPLSDHYYLVTMYYATHHSDEYAKLWTHLYDIPISKDKWFLFLSLTGQYDSNLLGCYRQYWQLDSVEFIEATPWSGLSQPFRIKKLKMYSFNIHKLGK